ncbi:MAG: VOC family protein [Polyangiaceae bacterium]|nr:VOC family protein [Polyangiaceae bacterium]
MICGGLVIFFVRDVHASVRFYVETLGMKFVDDASGASILDAGGGLRIGLHAIESGRAEQTEPKDSVVVSLLTKLPIRETMAILENRGVTFDVQEIGSGTIAGFRDPDGNALCLFQPK